MKFSTQTLRSALIHVGALCSLAAMVSCSGDSTSPTVDDGPPGTFTEIYDTVLSIDTDSRCNFCHSMPASQVSNGKFHTGMDQAETYAALLSTTSESTACSGRAIVVPGQPDESLLVLKISNRPPCGNRMPLGGSPLSSEKIRLVRSWIAAGANDD